MTGDGANRLLERENARLTRLVADLARENTELRNGRLDAGTLEGPDGLRLRLADPRDVGPRDASDAHASGVRHPARTPRTPRGGRDA